MALVDLLNGLCYLFLLSLASIVYVIRWCLNKPKPINQKKIEIY